MTPSQKILNKVGLKDQEEEVELPAKQGNDTPENSRRSFFKKSALGGVALGGSLMFAPIEDIIAQSTQKVIQVHLI